MDADRIGRRIDGFVLVALTLLIAAHCFTKYEPYTFLYRDGAFYAQTNRAIAEDHTLRQEGVQPMSWYEGNLPWYRNVTASWSNLSVGVEGERYPKHSFLMPVLSTPLFLALGLPGLLVFNAICVVLGLFAAYRLAARHLGEPAAAVAVLALGSGPLVLYLAYAYSFDAFYGALVLGGAALLAGGRPAVGGLLLGLSLWAKPTNVVLAAPLALALTTWDRRTLVRLAVGGAIPLVAFAVANTLMYGYPWLTSYSRMLVVEDGQPRIESLSEVFDAPLAEGLERLWDGADGYNFKKYALLPLASVLGMLPLGWLAVRRARQEPGGPPTGRLTAALLVAFAGFVFVFGRYELSTVRFFYPWLLAAVIPLAAILRVAAGLSARALAWWRGLQSPRARWAAAVASLALLIGATAAARVAHREPPSLHADLERLTVTLADTPCDYLNLSRMAWECSKREAKGGYLVGRALGDRCEFAEEPMLWAPPSPNGRERVIRWVPDEPSDAMDVVWGFDETAAKGVVSFTVQVGKRRPYKATARDKGELSHHRLAGPFRAGEPVTVTIPGTRAKKRFLCLNVKLADG